MGHPSIKGQTTHPGRARIHREHEPAHRHMDEWSAAMGQVVSGWNVALSLVAEQAPPLSGGHHPTAWRALCSPPVPKVHPKRQRPVVALSWGFALQTLHRIGFDDLQPRSQTLWGLEQSL